MWWIDRLSELHIQNFHVIKDLKRWANKKNHCWLLALITMIFTFFLQSEVEFLPVFPAVSCQWIDSVWQSGNFPNLQSRLYVWTGKYSDPTTQGETPNSPSCFSSSLWMMCVLQSHRWHLKVIVCQGSYTAYQWQNKCLLSCLRTWWIGSLGHLSAPTSRDWNQTSFRKQAGHSWIAPCNHWSRHETGEEGMLDRNGSKMSRCPEILIRKRWVPCRPLLWYLKSYMLNV